MSKLSIDAIKMIQNIDSDILRLLRKIAAIKDIEGKLAAEHLHDAQAHLDDAQTYLEEINEGKVFNKKPKKI